MLERRSLPRIRSYLGGFVEFSESSTFECVIRNISHHGARIVCAQNAILPVNVVLEITKREQRLTARIIWQSHNECGVSFVSREGGAEILPFRLRGRPR
ncbi:MAG: PilZ domain-containing protein [Methylocystis sp.]|jgi:hypothetical protein